MIYDRPDPGDPLDQGDLIEGCPVVGIDAYDLTLDELEFDQEPHRVLIVTQTCDFANAKVTGAVVAEAFDAQFLVETGVVKADQVRTKMRQGQMWGLYFLPADAALGLPEMVVDLRRLHTVRLDLLRDICRAGRRRGRVRPLYREHLAKHFADTYSRIGLPRPYETM